MTNYYITDESQGGPQEERGANRDNRQCVLLQNVPCCCNAYPGKCHPGRWGSFYVSSSCFGRRVLTGTPRHFFIHSLRYRVTILILRGFMEAFQIVKFRLYLTYRRQSFLRFTSVSEGRVVFVRTTLRCFKFNGRTTAKGSFLIFRFFHHTRTVVDDVGLFILFLRLLKLNHDYDKRIFRIFIREDGRFIWFLSAGVLLYRVFLWHSGRVNFLIGFKEGTTSYFPRDQKLSSTLFRFLFRFTSLLFILFRYFTSRLRIFFSLFTVALVRVSLLLLCIRVVFYVAGELSIDLCIVRNSRSFVRLNVTFNIFSSREIIFYFRLLVFY